MKNIFKVLSILLIAVLVLAGCSSEAPKTDEPVAEEAKPLRIAIVTPSTINDLAFSQSISDAMQVLKADMGDNLEYAYSENMFVIDDAAAAIRDYAQKGYDIILAHGSQYGSSVQEIAPDFPDTVFAHGTTVDTFGLSNVYAYEAASDQGGFVNGVTAALLTKSKIIGVVGPIETGDAKLYIDGFVKGVHSVDPEIDVRVTYIGSFSDVALAAEAATTHLSAGADVLTGSAQMVVGAIGKAQEAGAWWFGTQADQTDFAPDVVVASQVYHWEIILREIIAKRDAGVLGGESFAASLENGGQVIHFNPALELPEGVMDKAQSIIDDVIAGKIETH